MPYIGNSPGTGTRNRYIYTATASQTTFSGADDNGKTLAYSDGDYVDVFLNGICLVPVDDYTATSKTSIVLTVGAAVDDILEVVAYDIATIADTVSKANGGTFESTVTFNDGIVSTTGGTDNVSIGTNALDALDASSPGGNNVAIGTDALGANTTGSNNTVLGFEAGYDNTTGGHNTFLGRYAGHENTTASDNVAVGSVALYYNTTGTANVAVGRQALNNNTTADKNTAVGYQAGQANTTGFNNTFLGYQAGIDVTTGDANTLIGDTAGYSLTTSTDNTFVGRSCGQYVSSGSKNTILGRYNGNQGGLDIRTSSNNIVLSDGDGNPRVRISDDGDMMLGKAAASDTTGITFLDDISGYANSCGRIIFNSGNSSALNTIVFQYNGSQVGYIQQTTTATSYNTSSDHRLKENVTDVIDGITRLKQLEPKRFNFIVDADTTVDGFLAHEVQSVVPEAITGTHNEVETWTQEEIDAGDAPANTSAGDNKLDGDGNTIPVYQGIDQSKLVPLLTAALQEAIAKIETLETEMTSVKSRLDALEAN